MKAIILAAGKGSRLGEYVKDKPKCLLDIGGETLLSREIRLLRECGISKDDIYVVGGYCHEKIENVAPNLIINRFYDKKDNSYSLGLALNEIEKDDFLILDSDLCFEKELLYQIIHNKNENVLLSKISNDEKESTGILMSEEGYIKGIGKQYKNSGYVYLSIFKIGKETVKPFLEALLTERSEKTWYTYAITQICDKYKFYNEVTVAKWHEIDFVEDYMETLKLFNISTD